MNTQTQPNSSFAPLVNKPTNNNNLNSFQPPSTSIAEESRCPPPTARNTNDERQTIDPPEHPADKFGKTITVSQNISWNSSSSPRSSPLPTASTSVDLSPVVHFSPSRSGAFLPYRQAIEEKRHQPILCGFIQQPKLGEEEAVQVAEQSVIEYEEINNSSENNRVRTSSEETEDEIQAANSKMLEEEESLENGRVSMKISESNSKDTASLNNDSQGMMRKNKPFVPPPIATTHKRTLSSVKATDETPKHINVSGGNKGGSFHYPKRTKLTEEGGYNFPPDLSEMNTRNRRSYSLETLEDQNQQQQRQDQPTITQGASWESLGHGRESFSGGASLLNGLGASYEGGSLDNGQGPSWNKYIDQPGLSYGGLDATHSLSWEVPAGTLSTIGSTLSFGQGAQAAAGNPMLSPNKTKYATKKDDMVMEDDFPPIPSVGSLPMKKRGHSLPSPRQEATATLFQPPRPSAREESRDDRTIEVRDGGVSMEGRESSERDGHPTMPPLNYYGNYYGNQNGRDQPPGYYSQQGYEPTYGGPQGHMPWGNRHPQYDGVAANSQSFEERSFSLDEDPGQSLLYRPSFSWERGLEESTSQSPLPPLPSVGSVAPKPKGNLIPLPNQQDIMKTLAMRSEIRTIGNPADPNIDLMLLLAMPTDQDCLNETLCILRNNIEVFTATEEDAKVPAPGRKKPVLVGQVGLRCVYCRCQDSKDRTKRHTCFPTSMKRIYRSIMDMKLDHFKDCPHVPAGLKARMEELDGGKQKRGNSTIVSYVVNTAKMLGIMDRTGGIHIDLRRVGRPITPPLPPPQPKSGIVPQQVKSIVLPDVAEKDKFFGKVALGLAEDTKYLSKLRCFLRSNICVFTASVGDINVRSPTTPGVKVGQVGVGCIHCLSLPPNQRTNRSVCFPNNISRMYQSVADIQRFHLADCKMMPPDVRAEFVKLQSESDKGSRGLSTRKYWDDSAKALGLADSSGGIYFCKDPSLPPFPLPSQYSDITSGADSNAQVVLNNNVNYDESTLLVTDEDKGTCAQFLYLTIKQLKPCKFTEADRNKRRSKPIGTIGVECRHCSGRAEGRKFFWNSISAAESNFVSVHTHFMKCKFVPEDLKAEIARTKELRRAETTALKPGSQKQMFTRVWARLHGLPVPPPPSPGWKAKRNLSTKKPIHNPSDILSNSITLKVPTKKGGKDKKLKVVKKTEKAKYPVKKKVAKALQPPGVIHQPSNEDPSLPQLPQDSDEIRLTLSSMPSIDDSIIQSTLANSSSIELHTGPSSESVGKVAANMGEINICGV